jgi:hypothetical protein
LLPKYTSAQVAIITIDAPIHCSLENAWLKSMALATTDKHLRVVVMIATL